MQRLPLPGITVDSPTSRDLDDAIWVEGDGSGWTVYVSITDVAGAIPQGSRPDQIALMRGFTRYHAKGNTTMLPRRLAEDELSLLPDQERLTLSVTARFSASGEMTDFELAPTRLQSRTRYSYEEAAALVNGSEADSRAVMFKSARDLAHVLLDRRRAAGALAFYDLRLGWETTEEGFYRKTPPNENNVGHVIVQELMIATGTAMAQYAVKNGIPVLFRNHRATVSAPDRDALLRDIAQAVAVGTSDLALLFSRIDLVLERATYGRHLEGHYGLSLAAYLHGTSPLRRYPDLVNQRQIRAALLGTSLPHDDSELDAIAGQINQLEKEVKDARNKYYADKRKSETARALEAAAFASLDPDKFNKVLAMAVQAGAVSSELMEACQVRLTDGRLGARDFYEILVQGGTDNSLRPLQVAVLDYLAANPAAAPSVLSIAGQLGWSVIKYQERRTGPDHAPAFTVSARVTLKNADPLVSGEVTATSLKVARQRACVVLLGRHLGYDPIFPDIAPSPSVAAVQEETPLVNFKSILNELCQKQETWGRPVFEITITGPPHAREFVATVILEVGGDTRKANGTAARTQARAEQLAVQQLLRDLNII